MDANDQLRSPEEYRNLIIAWQDEAPLRLGDILSGADLPRTGRECT